jgi:uncharacterized protein (TIGR00297 family)
MLLMTLGATKFRAVQKTAREISGDSHGRNAAQVVANLGIAALAGASCSLIGVGSKAVPMAWKPVCAVAAAAALAEATADTLSSELGSVLQNNPVMITTFRRAPAGTNGAISIAGSIAGIAGAAIVSLLSGITLKLSPLLTAVALSGAIAGLFFDSLLGATLENSDYLTNDSVNLLSTVLASGAAIAALWCLGAAG